jgi:hypothetical protein
MSRKDTHVDRPLRRPSLFSLARRAGKAMAPRADRHAFEQLEGRVLLAGDEPNFSQVFNVGVPLIPPEITIDPNTGIGIGVTGQGSSVISPAGEDDVFRFTAPFNDFVRIWVDSLATNSTLDSRVEIYTGIPGGNPTAGPSGSNNGPISGGVSVDGWVGFKAVAGTEYFIVVKSDLLSGPGSTGDYTLRVNAKSTAFPALSTVTGDGTVAGNLTIRGGDVVYQLQVPSGADFNGLMTILGTATAADLDVRIDVYSTGGTFVVGDSDSGNLTDSFLGAISTPNTVYYIRVRSDEIGDPATRPSTGAFNLTIDAIPDKIDLDPVTRLSEDVGGALDNQKDANLYSFVAQGTGLTFISLSLGNPPLADSALRIYNEAAVQIGFNELPGALSRLIIQLQGGTRYFVVVDSFDALTGGAFVLRVEAHHTFEPTMTEPLDDHVNTPVGTGDPARRQFELATPIIWGAPQDAPVPVQVVPPLPNPGADHVKVLLGMGMGRIHAGGDSDLFQFVPPIDMLGNYEGIVDPATLPGPPNAPQWETLFRPATRLQITSTPAGLIDVFRGVPTFRVFDSNFNVIYTSPNASVITNMPALDAVHGALDPASVPPALPTPIPLPYTFGAGQPAQIEVWGGEVYYLEVTATGTGRYEFTLQVDAPTDTVSNIGPTVVGPGNFANAWEVRLDTNTGEGRNYNNVANGNLNFAPGVGYFASTGNGTPVMHGRGFAMNVISPVPPPGTNPPAGTGATVNNLVGVPGTRGQLLLRMADLGLLTSATDADLFQFRALYTGYAEVRLNTTALADEFWEAQVQSFDQDDPLLPPLAPDPNVEEEYTSKTKTYNSPLDGALRIFDNDQTEIIYNNDNGVTTGESDTTNVGAFAGKTFWRRDPRVVFPVVAGTTYYIQVESGQRSNFSLTFPKVDWRRVAGSYELLVNTMPNLNFDDDHVNLATAQASPIPTDLSVTTTTANIGTADGQIDNTLNNPDDTDLFTFISPGNGAVTFTLSTRFGDSFDRILSIFDANGVFLATAQGFGTADVSLSAAAIQGDRFFVLVDGDENGTPEGRYSVSVKGVPLTDDHASESNYLSATVIPKDSYDYDGTETVNGTIETAGDTDIFTFDSLTFDMATITVTGAPGFSPSIRVFEVSVDPVGNPIRLQIANNQPALGGTIAAVTFTVSAPPRTTAGGSYPTYYVVVSGNDPNLDRGAYTLNLSVTKTTDDHPDGPNPPPPGTPTTPGQFDVATVVTPNPSGAGSDTGEIGVVGDTDLFTFVSPAQGLVTVVITSPAGSLLLPRVRIIDEALNVVLDEPSGNVFVTGQDLQVSQARFRFTATRNAKFYIMVEGAASVGNVFKTDVTGIYNLALFVPIPDDHANIGEFPLATNVPLSSFSGDGGDFGTISPATDSDLFRFLAIESGTMVVTIATAGSPITPVLRFYSPTQQLLATVTDGDAGDEDGQLNGSVTKSFSIVNGSEYWVLVSSSPSGQQTTGTFFITLNGPTPPPGPDDHADRGDFANATQVILDQVTGDAVATGTIEAGGDTDLFYFFSLAGSISRPFQAFVQVVTPTGQTLDLAVRVIRQDQTSVILTDSLGGPGFNAGGQFSIEATTERYYIEVEGLGLLTGTYTVRIDTSPEAFHLFFPDGVSNDSIREYISIGNANTFDVNYTIRLIYEDTTLTPVVITGTVAAGKRGGATISDGNAATPPVVVPNKRYAIVVESDGFLAANLSQYENDASGGEALAFDASTLWSFARGEKLPGAVNDFVDVYNHNPGDSVVTLTWYKTDGSSVSTGTSVKTVAGFQRARFDFINDPNLPVGQFAFTISSAAAIPSSPHVGVIASLNHNDLADDSGYTVMGDRDGGNTAGVIPGVVDSGNLLPSQFTEVTFFNSSNATTTINLRGRYLNSNIPDLIRPISLAPFETLTLTGVQLGLVANQTVGLRYDSNNKVTMLTSTKRFGDSDASHAQTQVGNRWYFGDAFINRLRAGQLYFESMYFYNPAITSVDIQLRFVFNVGTESSYSFSVSPGNYARVDLHQLAAILNHAVFNYFSIEAFSLTTPFSVTMTHYDLVLGGGWGTGGAPLGLTNPISSLT